MLKSKVAFCVGASGSPQASVGVAASPTTSGAPGGGASGHKKVGKRRQQYQEKQRLQIEALQRLLDGKVAEFSVVAGEHRRLRQKLRVLEAVLPASEQHLASLTFSQNGSAPWELMEELFIFDDNDTDDTCCCTESQADAFSPCTTAASDDLTNTANLTNTATADLLTTTTSSAYCAAAGASSSSAALPSPPAGCGRAASGAAATTTTTTLRPRNTLASGTVCWRTVGDVLEYVRNFIRECSFLAHSVTAHNNSPRVLARISALVNPLWELVSLKHPDLAHEALYTNVETGEREDLPETFWHDVAAQVQFSEQQLQDMRAAMELYNSKVTAIMNDRLVLGALIDAAMAAQPPAAGASATSSAAMVASVELEVLVRHMQCNLAAELAARRILIEMCSQKIISDYQRAMIFVSSFPYVADISAVVAAVVEMAEASSASGSTAAAPAPAMSLATATAAAAVQEAAMHNITNAKGADVENFWPSMLGDGDFMLPADTASMPTIKEECAMQRKFGRC